MVWQARQVELGRLVAIKELSPALLSAPGFLERFRAEAQMLAGLDDPHVVRLYDYVEEPHRAFLVQEWVEGAPLTAVLDRHGRLTAEQSLGVIRGGLLGLAHAHQRGLVHRDVSTANILLDGAGVSKLVDFGLAAP
ncbi:MAG: serine/threonine protein kinase, partial [Actinomycetota bacterium]|nr:serine/threonine protein kinase [Actinomycetota bacterium]